jgi:Tol biopolymer transport system component
VADGDCSEPSISADGTRVAFLSEAANLSPASDGTYRQVFVRDLSAGTTSLISAIGVGQAASAHCLAPHVSGDGQLVVYSSMADNLAAGDTNDGMDAFICDLTTGTTSLLACTPEGAQVDGQSAYPVISQTGRYVAFLTNATQWGGAVGQIHLVRLDRQTGSARFVADITEAEMTMYTSLTADGQTLAYSTGDVAVPQSVSRVFLYDAAIDTSTCLTPNVDGDTFLPTISPDGYYLAFASSATNLVTGYAPDCEGVYLQRLKTLPTPPSDDDPVLPPAPPAPPAAVIPPTGGQATTTLGTGLTLVVPPQALSEETRFVIVVPDTGLTIIPSGATLLTQYQITATGSSTDPAGSAGAPVTSFARPIALAFGGLVVGSGQPAAGSGQPDAGQPQITPEQAATAYVCYWDPDYETWIPVPTEFDPVRGVIIGHTDHLTTYSVMLRPDLQRFTDVADSWAQSHILKLAALNVVSGNGDGSFGPDSSITREQFAKMIVLAAGLQPDAQPQLSFTDANLIADWAKPYVSAAARAGIINGLDGNRFAPTQLITRAEVATMVARALRNAPTAQTSSGTAFADAASIPDWARASVDEAVSRGIVGGYADGTFGPQLTATRAEVCKMLARLADLLLKGK